MNEINKKNKINKIKRKKRGTIQLYNLQSTTMPILSLNSHNMPTGATSYSALGLSGASAGVGSGMPPGMGSSLTHHTLGNVMDTSSILGTGLTGGSGVAGLSGLTGAASLYGLGSGMPGGGMSSSVLPNAYAPPYIDVGSGSSYPFTSAALRNASKMKMLDEIDIPLTRYGNRSSPCSPIPPSTWGLDEFTDSMSASMMHTQRGLALGALDLESKFWSLKPSYFDLYYCCSLHISSRSYIKWC